MCFSKYFFLIFILIFIVFRFDILDAIEQTYDRCFVHKEKKYGICFFNVPKNASNTIRNALDVNKFVLYDSIKKEADYYTKIMCVRNPLYKPISIYNEIMKLRKDGKYNITLNSLFYSMKRDPCLSFKYFLDFVDGNFYDGHLSHQHLFLEYKGLSLRDMDFILLFEDLDADLKRFGMFYGKDFNELKLNLGDQTVKILLTRYVDENVEIQNKIKKIWSDDFLFYEQAQFRRKEILQSIEILLNPND